MQRIRIGKRAFVQLIDLRTEQPLPLEVIVDYDLRFETLQGELGLADLIPHILYAGERLPSFVVKARLDTLLHGSCRKPHYPSADALASVDGLIEETRIELVTYLIIIISKGNSASSWSQCSLR